MNRFLLIKIATIWQFFAFLAISAEKKPFSSAPTPPPQNKNNQNDGEQAGAGVDSANNVSSEVNQEELKKMIASTWQRFQKPKKISRFAIDDRKYAIKGLVVGFKDYLSSQTPYLIWDNPPGSGFSEIMRCSRSASIGTGLNGINFSDFELSATTNPTQLSNLYRENDIWGIASESSGCEIINLAFIGQEYLDSWAKSGSYRYLVRACFSPEMLTDSAKLTSRFCSRQVAVSNLLEHYENKRKDEQNNALKEAEHAKAMLSQKGLHWYNLIKDYGEAIKACEEREFKRAVRVAKKQAIITLSAAGAGLLYELTTTFAMSQGKTLAQKFMYNYTFSRKSMMQNFGTAMNFLQLSGEAGGLTFTQMFTDLSANSEDMPRACAKGIRLDMEVKNATESLVHSMLDYKYHILKAQNLELLDDILAGEKELPSQVPEQSAEALETTSPASDDTTTQSYSTTDTQVNTDEAEINENPLPPEI